MQWPLWYHHSDGNTDGLNIINAGLIAGEIFAFGGAGNTTIRNTGTIIGGVAFGSGNDRYDGRGVCEDAIYGGAGADTFVVEAGTEVLIGGLGTDVLDFRLKNGIRVYLDGQRQIQALPQAIHMRRSTL